MKTQENEVRAGLLFISPRHANACAWTVLYYHRNGNWVCREPDHGTSCHFSAGEIMDGVVEENPINVAYRAEQVAEKNHRRAYSRVTASNPTEQDHAAYRDASKELDAARAVSAKLDAELRQLATF